MGFDLPFSSRFIINDLSIIWYTQKEIIFEAQWCLLSKLGILVWHYMLRNAFVWKAFEGTVFGIRWMKEKVEKCWLRVMVCISKMEKTISCLPTLPVEHMCFHLLHTYPLANDSFSTGWCWVCYGGIVFSRLTNVLPISRGDSEELYCMPSSSSSWTELDFISLGLFIWIWSNQLMEYQFTSRKISSCVCVEKNLFIGSIRILSESAIETSSCRGRLDSLGYLSRKFIRKYNLEHCFSMYLYQMVHSLCNLRWVKRSGPFGEYYFCILDQLQYIDILFIA